MAEAIKNVVYFNGINGQYGEQVAVGSGASAQEDFDNVVESITPTLRPTLKVVKQFYGNNIYLINMQKYNQVGGDAAAKYLAAAKVIGTY